MTAWLVSAKEVMMKLSMNAVEVGKLLLQETSAVSAIYLADYVGISRRSLYTVMTEINALFESQDCEPIFTQRNYGFFLNECQRKILSSTLNTAHVSADSYMRQSERIILEKILLFKKDNDFSVSKMETVFAISRNTVFSDIKLIRKDLAGYGLNIHYDSKLNCYSITGDEFHRRSALVFMLYQLLTFAVFQQEMELLQKYAVIDAREISAIQTIYGSLKEIELSARVTYVNGALEVLSILIVWIQQSTITLGDDFDFDSIKGTPLLIMIQQAFKQLDENNCYYVAAYLLSTSVQSDPMTLGEADRKYYEAIVDEMVERFSRASAITFSDDKDLKKALMQHIVVTYQRYKYGVNLVNPLLSKIKESYKDLFKITHLACDVLRERLKTMITDDEAAYITMIFGGFIRRTKAAHSSVNILLVCPNGISTSVMLQSEIESLNPMYSVVGSYSEAELETLSAEYDFIISTIKLDDRLNYIQVHPILSDREKNRIIEMAGNYISETQSAFNLTNVLKVIAPYIKDSQHAVVETKLKSLLFGSKQDLGEGHKVRLIEILGENEIQFSQEELTWEAAIAEAASPLLKSNKITPAYTQAMIESVRTHGPYIVMNETYAFAHANAPSTIHELSCSLLISRCPIAFGEHDKVQIVIVLAALDRTSHLKIVSDFLELFQNQEIYDKLVQSRTETEVMSHLADFYGVRS